MSTNGKNAIIGQDALVNKIDNYTIDTLPHAILLEGKVGCGKHLMCSYIAEKFNLELVELVTNDDRKDIDGIVFNPNPSLYVVDLSNVLPKFQNSMLKILEEPPSNVFFVCLCSHKNNVLKTIFNRCVHFSFSHYTKDILEVFAWDYSEANAGIALRLYDTPGKILKNKDQPLEKIQAMAVDVVNRIGNASYPNVLSISNKLAFKNEKNKYDVDTFVQALRVEVYDRIVHDNSVFWLRAYDVIKEMQGRLSNCIYKQRTFDGYLIRLKEVLCDTART